ncbi:DUF6520 family protein [Compostibacter hankyongensis]|uniref:Uncharacterized protein n=1 Tax=Compostibacter hankyongensis TaxID=1007089 RepID=A0ABP8G4L9_9BACT
MKKLKVSLTALALTAGVAGAFAATSSQPIGQLDEFSYVKSGSPNFTGTREQAQDNYDCHGQTNICALAYDPGFAGDGNHRQPSQDIFLND